MESANVVQPVTNVAGKSKESNEINLLKQSLQGTLLPTEIVDGKITKYTKLDFFTEDENENTVEE